jgi:hypothetical protein
MAVYSSKRLFSVREFEQMDQAGIFREDDRLELIDGEIFETALIGSRHAACVRRLQRLFTQELGERVLVDVQNPIRVARSFGASSRCHVAPTTR